MTIDTDRTRTRHELGDLVEVATGTTAGVEHTRDGRPLDLVEHPSPDVDRLALVAVQAGARKERRRGAVRGTDEPGAVGTGVGHTRDDRRTREAPGRAFLVGP